MTGSRRSEEDLLARTREGLWELQDLGGFRAGLLALLRELVDCDMISYNELGRKPEDVFVLADPEITHELDASLEVFAELLPQNPLAAYSQRTGDGRVLRLSDFISRRGLHALELYDVFYRPLGVESQMAFTVPARGQLIGVALSRGARDFSERERARLEHARRHVVTVYRNLRDRAQLEVLLRALDGPEDGPVAVFLLEESGVLQPVHERAERVLRQIVRDRSAGDALRSWARLQRGRSLDGARPLRLSILASALEARFLPGPTGSPDAIAIRPRAGGEAQSLRALGLTRRQAEVLHLVWQGRANAEIALALGVSEHTVRHHLESIYRALDVGSRAAAAHLAGSALARVDRFPGAARDASSSSRS